MTKREFNMNAVERALETLVLAYCEERRRPSGSTGKIAPTRFTFESPLKPRKVIYREAIVREPMAGALRLAIRELGEHIHALTGSTGAMLGVLESVAGRHPECMAAILSAVDHAWDGVGRDRDSPGWVLLALAFRLSCGVCGLLLRRSPGLTQT